jgi:hypothetical protein
VPVIIHLARDKKLLLTAAQARAKTAQTDKGTALR